MFRGEDGETREPVVIKVVRVGLTPERAAVVGAALVSVRDRLPSHPALAACFDAGVVDVEPYVVSAWIDGDSLDVALRQYGPALLVDALPRLRLLADGLDLAAAAGLSHGSLHPRDILVAVEHTVLQGLGVAGVLERVGVRPPVRRPYCAPEVALGLGISPAGDQYSLAAIAHEWLTGRRLAAGQEQTVRVPGLTGDAAEAMRAVFSRALAESPDDRFPSATAFVEAMAALAPHAPGRPKPSRRPPAAAPPRLAFDEPDEPVALASPPTVLETAGATEDATAVSLGDHLDAVDRLVIAPEVTQGAIEDLTILRDTPGSAAAWDDNPLSDFTVATAGAGSPTFALASDRDDAADGAGDDEVVPDDGIAVPRSPVIVTPAAPEPDLVAASLPIDEAGPTSWDDHEAAPADAPAEDVADAAATDGERAWTMWVAGIVAFTLLAVAGGWALVRWGTPSAPIPGARAAVEAPAAPAAVTETPRPAPAVPAPSAEPSAAASPPPAASAPQSPSAPPSTASARPSPSPASGRPASPGPPAAASRPTPAPRQSAAPARAERPRTTPAPAPARPAPAAAPQTPAPAESAVAPGGNAARLLVRSTPGGAEVFVNGERRGVTPLALRDLPLGSYAVRITRAGFAPVDERVVLERGRPSRSLEVTLARAGTTPAPSAARAGGSSGATGILTVETRPPGARVIVDGNDVGATPLTLPALAAGSHRIRIERPGYTPITTTTTIEAGARARVAVTLTPERP